MNYFRLAAFSVLLCCAGQVASAADYKPTIEDWVGVKAAVDNYAIGLDLHSQAIFDKAFWPEATVTIEPEPGKSFKMPYRMAQENGKPPAHMPANMKMPGPAGGTNAVGTNIAPWHLQLSHHFEFQSATHATHYGIFLSVYPDLKTKITTVGLPGHYQDVLEKRNGEWRILQRITAIGVK